MSSIKEEKFKQLEEMADKAVKIIQNAKGWIDSLTYKSLYPPDWKEISQHCDDLIDEIDVQVYREKQEQK